MPANWKAIIQECRHFVPVIEGARHFGAGLLISSDGLIVTNAHVVEDTDALLVDLHDGTRAKGAMIHRHQRGADLAVVRAAVHTNKFFPLPDRLAQGYDDGDEVLAIGHPRGLQFTSTTGIVSQRRRDVRERPFPFVQTDVAMNPGNSGGPLLDVQGNLVGINTWGRADAQGLGFAIPGERVCQYLQEFLELQRAGGVVIPSDEQLAALELTLSPEELFAEAAELAELAVSVNEEIELNGRWWNVLSNAGNEFFACIDDQRFLLIRPVADLDPDHRQDPRLLYELLRLQNEMGCTFTIDNEDNLRLRYVRPCDDLDVSDVTLALLEMSRVVDSYLAPVEKYFKPAEATKSTRDDLRRPCGQPGARPPTEGGLQKITRTGPSSSSSRRGSSPSPAAPGTPR